MKFHKVSLWSFLFFLGIIFFFIFMTSSMIIYKGGNFNNPDFNQYSFYENYLSDLGRMYTFTGELNTIPRILLQIAVIFGSFIIFLLFYSSTKLFIKIPVKNKIGLSGSLIGFLSPIFCLFAGFFLFDIYPISHRAFFYVFGVLFLISNILILINMQLLKIYPKNYVFISIFCNFLLISYIVIYTIIGPNAPYIQEIIKIIGQKLIIPISIFNFLFQLFFLNRKKDCMQTEIIF